MSKKILLLDTNYQVQSFISFKKGMKLLYKDKCEVISSWGESLNYGSSRIDYPAILRLKNPIKRNYFNSNFSRTALVKRDKSLCQFCTKRLSAANITIDHVIPRAQGGITSFTNCVVACQSCNNKKADRTPEQANMVLMKKPVNPIFSSLKFSMESNELYHPDWDDYLNT